jgi:3-keto-L-gulonate-6-phosphate decarboxylase
MPAKRTAERTTHKELKTPSLFSIAVSDAADWVQVAPIIDSATMRNLNEAAERRAKDATLDALVDKLVSAIGGLVSRIPARG